jgi:hypothetical protein
MMTPFRFATLLGLAGLGTLFGLTPGAQASALTPGNLVVVRMGDGSAALTSASTAVFLDEYTPAGVLVQSIPLPTAVSGTNGPFTNSGTATSEGFLNLSADGRYLIQGGYSAAPGVAGIATSTSTTAPRVIARTDLSGNVDTSTILNGDTSYSATNIRSATSIDGAEFWAAGASPSGAPADGGVRYVAALGANTSLQLATTPTNTRVITIASGQLYVSSASGTFQGVSTVGTGLPTTAGQTVTLLPGFPTATGPGSYDYFFADANTVFVADDRAAPNGGIQKWTQSAGTWTLQYTLTPASGGCRGLTGVVNAGVATLYATTTQTSVNNIVTVTDTGAGSPFTVVASAGTNTAFRGLRLLAPGASPGTVFCRGDGSATACPCGNNSPVGNDEGCLSSLGTGGKLVGTGTPSLAADTLLLTGTGMPNSSALYFQGTSQQGGGLGSAFGDGLRCAGGTVIRLGTKANTAGASQYPAAGDSPVSVRGLVGAPGTRTYQVWYRNAAAFCTSSTFNLSNGWEVTWAP